MRPLLNRISVVYDGPDQALSDKQYRLFGPMIAVFKLVRHPEATMLPRLLNEYSECCTRIRLKG